MKKYLIETSVIIPFLHGNAAVIQFLDRLDGELASSFVCLAELSEGVARVTRDREKITNGVSDFFAGMSDVYGINSDIARLFGKLRSTLKAEGHVIEDLDILIAATCLVHDLILITNNGKHFSRIKGLKIVAPQ